MRWIVLGNRHRWWIKAEIIACMEKIIMNLLKAISTSPPTTPHLSIRTKSLFFIDLQILELNSVNSIKVMKTIPWMLVPFIKSIDLELLKVYTQNQSPLPQIHTYTLKLIKIQLQENISSILKTRLWIIVIYPKPNSINSIQSIHKYKKRKNNSWIWKSHPWAWAKGCAQLSRDLYPHPSVIGIRNLN